MENKVLEVPTLSEEVYRHIRNQIIKGKLMPGEKVTIRQIAEMLGVSTMPVRESLKRLEVERFVRYERRSVIVNKLSANEVKEIFEIRKNLEKMAIEWALPNIKEQDLEELLAILEEMDTKLTDMFEWERLNKEFHLTLYSYSDSRALNQLLEQVWGSVEPYMHIFSSSISEDLLHSSQQEHYIMLQLIKNNEEKELISLTMEHLSYTCEKILTTIKAEEQAD